MHTIDTLKTATERELAARAADDAVFLAIHLAQRAGWPEIASRLLDVKQDTAARRRAVEAA